MDGKPPSTVPIHLVLWEQHHSRANARLPREKGFHHTVQHSRGSRSAAAAAMR